MFGCSKEAVRVKVKKCEGKLQPELRKFSVDPQITSLEVLQSILVKAFDIKSDFSLSYRSIDDYGQEVYLPLLSDWDLDAAFLKAHNTAVSQRSEPCCQLKVEMRPFAESSEDWEPPTISPALPTNVQMAREPREPSTHQSSEKQEYQTGFQGLIMNQVEKTFNIVSRALNLYEDPNTPPRQPLSDIEFRAFLDAVGQISNTSKLREVIYCGGIDPSLRKVVWKHILNVYPDGMTGRERMDYIKRKAHEYYALRACWKECVQKGKVNGNLAYVTSMVRKDVLRTDRHHPFYAGSDDNQNIASLFNILTTYALNHPTVSYCQGMSDLASPLLVTMGDEAHAYICLCALMTRLYPNFMLDGEAMTLKFSHLTEALQVYDPDFYNYLKFQQADDLLFCYRWLLLEMKREFAFDDALRMLEVLWASLPQKIATNEISLKEKEFDPYFDFEDDPPPLSPLVKTPRENPYTKVCAIRRQSSSFSLANVKAPKLGTEKQTNHSLDENVTRKDLSGKSLKHSKEFQSLDDTKLQTPPLELHDSFKDIKKEIMGTKDSKQFTKRSMKTVPEHTRSQELATKIETGWSGTGKLTNGTSHPEVSDTPLANQIRMLTDKISLHNSKFFSLEKLDDSVSSDTSNRPKVKMIKNLNEFLNFATGGKPGTQQIRFEKLQRAHSNIERTSRGLQRAHSNIDKTSRGCPKITLTNDELPKPADSLNHSPEANDGSSPDDSQEYYPMTTSMTRELRLESEHLDRQVFGSSYVNRTSLISDSPSDSTSTECKATQDLTDCRPDCITTDTLEIRTVTAETVGSVKNSQLHENVKTNAKSAEDIYLWENPLLRNTVTSRATASCPPTPEEQADLDYDGDTGEIFEEESGKKSVTPIKLLRKNQSLEPQETKHFNVHSSDSDYSGDPAQPVKAAVIKTNESGTPVASRSHNFFSSMSQELENAKKNCESFLNSKPANLQSVTSTINNFQKRYEVFKPPVQKNVTVRSGSGDISAKFSVSSLPPPTVFGGGNPFLMFLCLTVLLQHRDYIMRNRMDYNELAMHFDKMVRKHNVNRVLNQARQLYAMYLKHQAQKTGDVAT